MNTQRKIELLKTVIAHFEKQGKRAEDGNGDCAYLTTDGCKCAVGLFISPENYSPEMEGTMLPANLIVGHPAVVVTLPDKSFDHRQKILANALRSSGIAIDDPEERIFLRDLQKVHDGKGEYQALYYQQNQTFERMMDTYRTKLADAQLAVSL